mgnify:CR=1 FL=1
MSNFNPENYKTGGAKGQKKSMSWIDLDFATRAQLFLYTFAEVFCAAAWAASFSTVNPMGSGIWLADVLPVELPNALQDLSVASLVNFILWLMAVIIPAVLWHFVLRDEVWKDVRGFFHGNLLRTVVGGLLVAIYGCLIALEILALRLRVDNSLDIGPIPILGDTPHAVPLFLASAALVIGSALLGLGSASLIHSIRKQND